MAADKTRIVILGSKGMLGTDLVKISRQWGFNITALDLPEFDMTNGQQLEEAFNSTDVVINCAAYTNVDAAESKTKLAYQVNAEAVGWLGALAKKNGTWLVHISTDFVFDGRLNRPYVETDAPNPINTYGKSKLAGEQLLVQSGCRHCIIRVEWTYGSVGDNFITKLICRAKAGDALKVVDDQVGSPTATTEVAGAICELFDKRPEGLFHFASAGYVSRYEMAKFIFGKLSMDVDLSACKTADYPNPAARPLNSRFDCSKIQTLLDEPIEPWQSPLERFLMGTPLCDLYAK